MGTRTIAISPSQAYPGDDIYAVDKRGVADVIAGSELDEPGSFELIVDSEVDYTVKRNTSAKAFTADAASNVLTSAAHGFLDGETTYVQGTTLPGNLLQGIVYFVRDKTDDTLKLALTAGGIAIDLTTAGSGSMVLVGPKFRSSNDSKVGDIASSGQAELTAEGEESLVQAIFAGGDIDGFDLEESMRLALAALVGKVSATSTTFAARAADDSKARITSTTTPDGDRTAVTLDAS